MKKSNVEKSVFRITVSESLPDCELPWQTKWQVEAWATGFAIDVDKRWVLTNAHAVLRSTVVTLKRLGDDTRYVATILTMSPEMDLALLHVADPSFWAGISALDQLGPLPDLQTAVSVYGYPRGGENLSVTKGVMSRVEVTENADCSFEQLTVQIDAAINPGNSGGPVLDAQLRTVGVAFMKSNIASDDNIGYIIAAEVVQRFLDDIDANGRYTGVPVLGLRVQEMECESMRHFKGLAAHESGVLVQFVEPTLPAADVVQRGDVILAIDDVALTNMGKVPFRNGELVGFQHLINRKFVGDEMTLRILRNGERCTVACRLASISERDLVPTNAENKQDYYISGGLLFTKLTETLLETQPDGEMLHLRAETIAQSKTETLDEVVVLNKVLSCPINFSYKEYEKWRVFKFNGIAIRSLRHLAELVDNCTDQFLVFDIYMGYQIILNRKEAEESDKNILEQYGAPSKKRIAQCEETR